MNQGFPSSLEEFNFDDNDSSSDELGGCRPPENHESSEFNTPSNHGISDHCTPDRNVAGLPHSGVQDIIGMLQQQQSALQTVIDKQTSLEENQYLLEQSFKGLEMKFECLQAAKTSSTTPNSSECEGKRKRLVTRSLSVNVLLCVSL